jgi:hypothetical protein
MKTMNKKFKSICPVAVKLVNSQLHRGNNTDGAGYLKSGWPKLELSEIKKLDGSYSLEILPLEVVFVFDKKKNFLGAYNYKD